MSPPPLTDDQRIAIRFAIERMTDKHVGASAHYKGVEDWRAPSRCEACARMVLQEMVTVPRPARSRSGSQH